MGNTHRYADDCGHKDTEKHSSADLEDNQDRGKQESDYGQDGGAVRKRAESYRGRVTADDDTGRLEADESNVETDTCTDCALEIHRNRIHDELAHIGNCQQDEKNTFEEDRCQCHLP